MQPNNHRRLAESHSGAEALAGIWPLRRLKPRVQSLDGASPGSVGQAAGTGLLALSLALILGLVCACGPSPTPEPSPIPPQPATEPAPAQGGRLVYGLTLAPSGIDPHIDASSELGIPLTSVYDTLVYQDPDGSYVPGLAERWELSDDGLVYTLHLRSGVQFHDGTPFDAQAVQFNLDRIASPDTKSRKARGMLGPYDHTEIVDAHTVKVHFQEPYAPFLDSASQVYLGMASPAAVDRWGADYQLHQVGTGPFLFKEYVPNDHLTLARNPDYAWAPEVYDHDGPAYLDEIEFRFYVDPAVRALALESGEAHVMGEVPPQDAVRLEDNEAYNLYRVPVPGQPLQLFLNTEKPPTDDLRVRRALLHASDGQAIVSTIFQDYSPAAQGPLNTGTMGYDPAIEGMYTPDPDRAAALLAEAGWTDSDGDGIRDKEGQPLTLQAYLMGWGYLPEVGQMLQAQFLAVGIDLQTQTVAFPAALEAAGKGEHHLAPMTYSSSDPSVLGLTYLSSNADGGFNWSKVRDPDLDGLLESGVRTLDPLDRASIYSQAQMRIMELALVLPIREYVNLNAARAEVQGLQYDRRGWFPWLHSVHLEPAP
jgi:peptide/nickel transport system substrate-binding protein